MSKQANTTRKLALDSPDRKPSVFERLGSKSCVVSGKNVCRSWAQNGSCPLNKSCKFAHTHVLFSPSKRSKVETMKKSVIVHKKSKDEHKKSLRSHQSSEREWEGWELGDLEDADEKVLEKRKQELQRELQLQLKKEKELTRKKDKRTEKKRAASTSSSSSSTTESSSSSTSSSSSSSEPKKRLSRKRKHATSSSDSEVSPHRRKKSPKTVKGKVTAMKKTVERKDSKVVAESKSKSVVVAKKSVVQKKSYSPGWEKSKGRSPTKQQTSKKLSPHHSPDSKNKSSSPRYEKTVAKSKARGFTPKPKGKEASPKRTMRKVKESGTHVKEKTRQSPSKTHKVSPGKSRRHEESSDKRRGHYEDKKHSPRRERSREKDRKRDVRRGRSHDDDNGGLKKGGKILPLKPSSYNKDNPPKKDTAHHKSSEKSSDIKSKEEENEKDRGRIERDRERNEKEKSKCDRDRSKHKKGSDEHDRRSVRDRDSDRNVVRSRDDRCRDREAERLRFAKEREAERQKERDEALERCRERQRERERLEKERKEKEDKKHQRDKTENEVKEFERELPSLLDLKAENPRGHLDPAGTKSSDKHLQRDTRRNLDKEIDKGANQGRDRGTPDKGHDRRDIRRSAENDRRLSDKDYESRRNREGDIRNPSEVRRSVGDGRRGGDDGDSRRAWDDVRRVMEPVHGRRSLDPINDRRQQPLVRRSGDDHYRRGRDGDLDVRDYAIDERQRRKLLHNHSDWDPSDQNLDYRDADIRDEWNHAERHLDWNSRYEHKWRDHEDSLEGGWNQYPRRPALDEWNGDWAQERPRYSEDRLEILNEEFPGEKDSRPDTNPAKKENTVKRHNESEAIRPAESSKGRDAAVGGKEEAAVDRDKTQKEGDALSDISDDPDDILNQEDEPVQENAAPASNAQNDLNQQIYVRSNEFLFEQRRPLLECLGERSLDFEEISDEELEEEARVSKGIVDVLGADWAGLVQETRLRPRRFEGPGSAHRRWLMDKILFRYGISYKMAGKKFADRLLQKYREADIKEFKAEKSSPKDMSENQVKKENEEDVKDEKPVVEELEKENLVVNGSPMEGVEETDTKPEGGILHPVPALNSAFREAKNMKATLFQSHNRFKRALSARTDLNLRRELCNFPSREPLHFTPPLESKLFQTSVQLFRGNISTAAV